MTTQTVEIRVELLPDPDEPDVLVKVARPYDVDSGRYIGEGFFAEGPKAAEFMSEAMSVLDEYLGVEIGSGTYKIVEDLP